MQLLLIQVFAILVTLKRKDKTGTVLMGRLIASKLLIPNIHPKTDQRQSLPHAGMQQKYF